MSDPAEHTAGSWDRTFADIVALPVGHRPVNMRPPGTYRTVEGADGYAIRLPAGRYYETMERLFVLSDDAEWGADARKAREALFRAACAHPVCADAIVFRSPTDSAVWSLVAMPDFDGYWRSK